MSSMSAFSKAAAKTVRGARMMSSEPWAQNSMKFQVKTYNAISPVGLSRFPREQVLLTGSSGSVPDGVPEEPHLMLLRSYKVKSEEVPPSVRAIARCGAGTNNIPVSEMTARGIPVFNTPGSNANAVKELVLCGMLLASRGIVEGIEHTKNVIMKEETDFKAANARVEKDKKMFVGQELAGKTLGVAGLGNIGASVAETALSLGMKVVGYDPAITVETAWRLPGTAMKRVHSLDDMFAESDYVSLNMPYIKDVTHHVVDARVLSNMKPTCHILNFARGELVDTAALLKCYEKGHKGKYIADFPDEVLNEHPLFVSIPHLGASTEEAEENSAYMAADQVMKFLETGAIVNSVNFPATNLERQSPSDTRLCVITENKPGMLGEITTLLGRKNINISQQINTSRGAVAYNVVDCQGMADGHVEVQTELGLIPGVLSSRVIWTGNAEEGPQNFFSYGGEGAVAAAASA